MSDNQILIYNALAYTVVTCLYFLRTDKKITIGLFMLSFYAVIAGGGKTLISNVLKSLGMFSLEIYILHLFLLRPATGLIRFIRH